MVHRRLICLLLGLALLLASLSAQDQPNIIVFIADDVSWNDFGCYGNTGVRTPHIDALAANGLKFTNAYLTASSCSPSRSSIITGRYPHNNGKAAELHLAIADHLPWLPELLQYEGYYTALSGKNHMKREDGSHEEFWDHEDGGKEPGNQGGEAFWVEVTQERPEDQPFFFWFASSDAHRQWDGDKDWKPDQYGPMTDIADVTVPPFLLDTPETRQDLASYYNEIKRFDYFIGQVVEELKEQDVLDNTLIFVLADNGRPFPRAKTRLHDSGMKTALVAHWPDGIEATGTCDSLVSVIDLAPTIVEVAEGETSETFQGVSMLPLFTDNKAEIRQYAFSEHNWHDYEALGRSVRTRDWLYLENFRSEQAWQGPADSVRSPSHQQLLAAFKEGKLNPVQEDVFIAPRPDKELYQVNEDIYQTNNLAENDSYAGIQKALAGVLQIWMQETGDSNPALITQDEFHKETGERVVANQSYRHETPGESNFASEINRHGPR
ncbi:MAG: sulfatase [Verrucomicrobia bacterium]|nr:sulfatase [Verrucomicrobiota bacterium]MDA1067262.1 sulfatase [Verrucomicrobiota bacterium]